jgi:hypothetical protein
MVVFAVPTGKKCMQYNKHRDKPDEKNQVRVPPVLFRSQCRREPRSSLRRPMCTKVLFVCIQWLTNSLPLSRTRLLAEPIDALSMPLLDTRAMRTEAVRAWHLCEVHSVLGKQERGIIEAVAATLHRKKKRPPVQ